MANRDWFTVDKEGLAALLARRGSWFVVYELIQNAFDEDGVTTVDVRLESNEDRRARATLMVEDDAPDGFADLTHAFTLFAPSKKKADAEKRGRFNLGEKLVLAVCESAQIRSTTGAFGFGESGRSRLRDCRPQGSLFVGTLRMTKPEVAEAIERAHLVIPPAGITLTVNGIEVLHREPLHEFKVSLRTEIEGQLRPTRRQTTVRVYEPAESETATIYEMGIPVVESEDRWHVDVGQKVPLNMDRDNVTPAYLRDLRTAVVNEMAERLRGDEAADVWVNEALASPDIEPAAVQSIVTERFGDDAVVYDPSDLEANKLAAAEGRAVIMPGTFNKAQWANVRETQAFRPAGQVTPSNSTLRTSMDGEPPIGEDNWTAGMEWIADYSRHVARAVLGFDVAVSFHNVPIGQRWAAAYGGRHLRFNVGQLGHRWFNEPNVEKVDALLIHEFGHEFSADHLSSAYHDALCDLGAKMKRHAASLADAWARALGGVTEWEQS